MSRAIWRRWPASPCAKPRLTCIGVNHCTWITEFRHRGRNAVAADRRLPRRQPTRVTPTRPPFSEAAPFSWELYQLYGAFPAVLDRHVTEFYPDICRARAPIMA